MMQSNCYPRNAFLLYVLLMLIVAGCGMRTDGYHYHNENIKGPAKKVVQRTFGAVKDSLQWKTGRLQQKRILVFDEQARLSSKRVYGPDTTLVERYEYTYETNNRKVERRYDRSGNLTHIKKYSYPWLFGSVKAHTYSPNDSLMWSVSYTFDNRQREIRRNVYGPEGNLNYQVSYRYNPDNFIIQREGVDKQTYQFNTFDSQDNWLRRLNSEGDITTSITTRRITYF